MPSVPPRLPEPEPTPPANVPTAPPPSSDSPLPANDTPPPAEIRIHGLSDTLHSLGQTMASLRETLAGQRKAGKFSWISGRLMVLRNIVIATAVLSATLMVTGVLIREAFRPTLTITAFDVPASVAERGLTGEVVARNLFNELLKRRKTITTFDTGNLTSLSGERQSDVASPDGKFSVQSIFRYLRSITGRETTIGGEMLVDNGQITLTTRVSGHPQLSVKGKLDDWESLLGPLADHVFEVTQPVVLVGYLAETAKTPEDLTKMSKLLARMETSTPPTSNAALSLAWHAYGVAFRRQGQNDAALAAWARARTYDPSHAAPYWRAAHTLRTSNPEAAERLYQQAMPLEQNRTVMLANSSSRFYSAFEKSDCGTAFAVLQQRLALESANSLNWKLLNADYLDGCEFRQAEAVAILTEIALLRPDFDSVWESQGVIQASRLDRRFLAEADLAFTRAVELKPESLWHRMHLARVKALRGEQVEAEHIFAEAAKRFPRLKEDRFARATWAALRLEAGAYAEAEVAARALVADGAGLGVASVLVRAIAAQSRVDEAVQVMRDNLAQAPLECGWYDVAAKILFDAKRDAEAFAQWQAGVRAVPKCDVTYLNHARALIERQRPAEARKLLETLLKVSPGSDGAELAKPLLAQLARP